MAHNADIQYVHPVYTNGTAARKLARKKPRPKVPLPLFEPQMLEEGQKIVVPVNPILVGGILISAVLLVMMVLTLFQFGDAYQENVALQEYVYQLRNENAQLEQTYKAGFDLAEIEAQAIALGMVPAEDAQIMQISGRVPAEAADPTLWDEIKFFFGELFANVR